jgi:hypothetical protein
MLSPLKGIPEFATKFETHISRWIISKILKRFNLPSGQLSPQEDNCPGLNRAEINRFFFCRKVRKTKPLQGLRS